MTVRYFSGGGGGGGRGLGKQWKSTRCSCISGHKWRRFPIRNSTTPQTSHSTNSLLTFGLLRTKNPSVTYNRTIYMDMYLVCGNNLPHVAFSLGSSLQGRSSFAPSLERRVLPEYMTMVHGLWRTCSDEAHGFDYKKTSKMKQVT